MKTHIAQNYIIGKEDDLIGHSYGTIGHFWGNHKSHDSLGNNDSTTGHRKWTIELYNDATIGQSDDIILVSEFAVMHSHYAMSHSEDI